MSASSFEEESAPIYIASMFGLEDFDSPQVAPGGNFTVVVTLRGAVDGGQEGLVFDADGTGVWVEEERQSESFIVSYTLQGSGNYTLYQMVRGRPSSSFSFTSLQLLPLT